MSSSTSCTLKCVSEPNHLGDHPAIVIGAYACAFLPLAVIYASDFVTEEWKTIKATRRTGLIHLFVSLPPLAFVILYIHLQRLMGDYKEMAAAITVAVFCISHVLRSMWGLVQLMDFKRWNLHALQCLIRMGYNLPPSETDTEDAVDNCMKVNSSLLDNEFRNVALPVKWDHKSFFRQFSKESFKDLSFLDHMCCTLPVECSVHWMVAFLSQFGSKWLMDMKTILKNEDSNYVKRDTRELTKLCLLSALHVTHRHSDSRSRLVSPLPPDHLFLSDPMESHNGKLKIGANCALPYGMRREVLLDDDFINFEEHESTILDASTSWDKKSLNKLTPEERKAVTAITPCHLACFSKLIQQAAWNTPVLDSTFDEGVRVSLGKGDLRVNTFLEQLGYGPEKDLSNVLQALPIRIDSIDRCLWDNKYRNRFLLQASVHADNWISLESGEDMKRFKATLEKRNISLREETSASEFDLQHEIEMKRLQYKASEPKSAVDLSLESARFLGCVTEAVRSFLSIWISDTGIVPSDAIWKPQGLLETVSLVCSRQLTTALYTHKKNSKCAISGQERSLFMRLLWELQSNLRSEVILPKEVAEGLYWRGNQNLYSSSSVQLMMLCILGYPSISIETTDDELRIEDFFHETTSSREQAVHRYKISPVEGPQKLHILLEIYSSGYSRLQLHGDTRTAPEVCFDWQLWKDAFMGRLSAQSQWRASRLGSDSEMLRREASYSNIANALVRKGEEETGVDYGLTFWSGWPPHLSQISQFELTESPKLLGTKNWEVSHTKSTIRRLEEALNAHFSDHQTATPSFSALVTVPVPDEPGRLEGTECRNSDMLDADADGVGELSTPELDCVLRRNEGLLSMRGPLADPLSHLYLGLCYLRSFELSGIAFHQLLAANHFKSFALRKRGHPVALTTGFLFEHGFLSSGDERLSHLYDEFPQEADYDQMKALFERYVIEDYSTQQRNQETRTLGVLPCKKTAAAIYEENIRFGENQFPNQYIKRVAYNRLGILKLRYDIRALAASAEDLFARGARWGNMDALCNMAVLKETQGNQDAAIDLLKDERLKSHSTALNNLAVIYEFKTSYSVDTARVKYLYEKAIEEDQNPVAKFNLAMLLKSEEDSSRANDILQDLDLRRLQFSRMEVLLREIGKAQAPQTYTPLLKDLEEVGDSIAFVKTR